MKNRTKNILIILPVMLLAGFLLLPVLFPQPAAVNAKGQKTTPQVFSDNPLAKLFRKLTEVFSPKDKEKDLPDLPVPGNSVQMAALERAELMQDAQGNIYSVVKDEKGNLIAVTPAYAGDAEVLSDGGDWVLVRQVQPGVASKGAYEANLKSSDTKDLQKQRDNAALLASRITQKGDGLEDVKLASAAYSKKLADEQMAKSIAASTRSGASAAAGQGAGFSAMSSLSASANLDGAVPGQPNPVDLNALRAKAQTLKGQATSAVENKERAETQMKEEIIEDIQKDTIQLANKYAQEDIAKEASKEKDLVYFNYKKDFECEENCAVPDYKKEVARQLFDEKYKNIVPGYFTRYSEQDRERLFNELTSLLDKDPSIAPGYVVVYLADKEDPAYKEKCASGKCTDMYYTTNPLASNPILKNTLKNATALGFGREGDEPFVLVSENEMKEIVKKEIGSQEIGDVMKTQFIFPSAKNAEIGIKNLGIPAAQAGVVGKEEFNQGKRTAEDFETKTSAAINDTSLRKIEYLREAEKEVFSEYSQAVDDVLAKVQAANAQSPENNALLEEASDKQRIMKELIQDVGAQDAVSPATQNTNATTTANADKKQQQPVSSTSTIKQTKQPPTKQNAKPSAKQEPVLTKDDALMICRGNAAGCSRPGSSSASGTGVSKFFQPTK